MSRNRWIQVLDELHLSGYMRSCSKRRAWNGKRVWLAPEIYIQYKSFMGGLDTTDHLRKDRTVRRHTQNS